MIYLKSGDLGEILYMGMGHVNGHRVCMSVAYKLDYCLKKSIQFEIASNDQVIFDKINKIKIGQLEAFESIDRSLLADEIELVRQSINLAN